jgi:outer membrane lipoprotein carrier protein
MMKYFFCLLLSYSLNVVADDTQDLVKLLADYKTIQGDFAQSLKDSKGEVIQQSSGIFTVKAPGFFLWDTQEPFPQLLVSNLQDIWLYDADLEQVTIRPYSQNVDQSPALLLSGNVEKISQTYYIKKVKSIDNNEVTKTDRAAAISSDFILTPKQTNSVFLELRLGFVDNIIQQMTLADSLGQTTRFSFNNIVLNQLINESIFKFSIPAGVDVLIDN